MNKFESKKKLKEIKEEAFINATNDKTKAQNSARGRKALKEEQKKSKAITLYLTHSDYESLKEKADKARLSLSQYITFRIFNEG